MNTENNYVETDLGNISPNPCGEYNPSMQYEYLDLVNYQGGSYLCTVELETKITGIAPAQGKNTECWQLVTLPGDLTPEYIAMHDDVVNKTKQVEASTAAAELAQQEAESALADVEQLHTDTVNAANKATESRDSAAGYASAAEQSRKAVKESEENVNAQVTSFDTHVAEKTQESEQAIADARQQAVQTVTKQEELSVQAVKDETAEYIEEQKNTAKEEINSRADEKIEEINQAYKPLDEKVESLNEDVNTLKSDTKELKDKKITKFYASNQGETHLEDSDSGKIMDLKIYGRSEQKQYKGINLFPPDVGYGDFVEVSIPKGTRIFGIADGTNNGGNFRFFNADKTEDMWFGIDNDTTVMTATLNIDAKYVQNLIYSDFDLSKICLGIGDEPIYEPYTGGLPSPNLDYPQEIKSVVNPVVTICGKNLLKATLETQEKYGISCKNNNDGTYTFNGTLTSGENADFYFVGDYYSDKPINNNNNNKFFGTIGLKDEIDGIYTFAIHKTNVIASGHTSFAGEGLVSAFMVRITKNVVLDNLVLKPMLMSSDSEEGEFEEYKGQVVTFPYTLNAIPVKKGGNYSDKNGACWICDEIDLERKARIQRIKHLKITKNLLKNPMIEEAYFYIQTLIEDSSLNNSGVQAFEKVLCKNLPVIAQTEEKKYNYPIVSIYGHNSYLELRFWAPTTLYETAEDFAEDLAGSEFLYPLEAPIERVLTDEEIKELQKFETYYPVTNILTKSNELNGYTTFNYPVSLENGWNYVKQQLGDNRDYIYNIDNRAQEIDMQSAEAYVNSEYAVALTELEVM